MKSKFWRTMAVLGVCGLFYVGHGLHSGSGAGRQGPMPWESAAQGLPAQPRSYSPWQDGAAPVAVTQSMDGLTLYFWSDQQHVVNPNARPTIQATIENVTRSGPALRR